MTAPILLATLKVSHTTQPKERSPSTTIQTSMYGEVDLGTAKLNPPWKEIRLFSTGRRGKWKTAPVHL